MSQGLQNWINIAQNIVTILVAIAGLFWFWQSRKKQVRANISHKIIHKYIDDEKILLHVTVAISNIGEVLLKIEREEIRVQQMIPIPNKIMKMIKQGENPIEEQETEILWDMLDKRMYEPQTYEIEPGEKGETCYDFVLNTDIETIEIYSYTKNSKKKREIRFWNEREIGWGLTTVYDFKKEVI